MYEDLDELSNAQIKEYLSNVRNASYHTYALLENLLEWSRIQSGKMPFTPSVFNLHDEINSVISVLDNNATRKEIKLINEVDPELMVEADRNMIHSVLQNQCEIKNFGFTWRPSMVRGKYIGQRNRNT